MSGRSENAEGQPGQPDKQLKPGKLKRRRRLVQIGCFPFTFLLTACLLLVINVVLVSKAPSWVTDPDKYLTGQRVLGSLGALTGLHLVGTWLLGLIAAAMAAGAAAGQGGMLRQRLTILHRRAVVMAWVVFLLRFVLLIALVVSILLVRVHVSGTQISFVVFEDFKMNVNGVRHLSFIVASVVTLVVMLTQFLFGSFLRLRYSMALGALAATWSRRREWRLLAAVTGRTGAGMLGSLALLWGGALGILIFSTVRQPLSRSLPVDLHRAIFPALTWPAARNILILLALTVLICLYMIGQVVLPPVYLWLARRRLASRPVMNKRSARRWEVKQAEKTVLDPVAETVSGDA